MIGPPNEDDNFSSFYVTWHHVLTIFSFSNFFWSSWRELWTLIVPNITRQITLRPNYLPVECATAILRGFFLDSNFVYWKLRAWRQQQRMLGLLSLRGPAVSLYSVSNFKTRKNENIWMKKKRFLNQSYRKIPTRMS